MSAVQRTARTRIALFAATISLAACGVEAPEAPPEFPMPVTVAQPIVTRAMEWDRYTGRFEAVKEIEVRARVSGYLKSIHFDAGSTVEAGDLLFILDDRPFQAALNEALAAETEAAAATRQAEAAQAQAQAELAQASSQRELALRRVARAEEALETNAISAEEVDVRMSELEQTKAAEAAAEASLAAAEAAIASAKAGDATAKTRVATARLQLSYCRIESPIDGRIGEHRISEGNFVQGGAANATMLTQIVSIDPIHCVFDASEQEFLKYMRLSRNGERKSSRDVRNPVFVSLLDEPGYPHRGHMDFVGERLRSGTGTIRGRAILRNPDNLLVPGLFATVRIPGSRPREVVLVPDSAIQPDQSTRYVLKMVEDNKTARVPVELGPLYRGLRIIKSGLDGSETIVVSGLMRVFPDAAVTPNPTTLELGPDIEGLPQTYAPVTEAEAIRVPRAMGEGR